MTNDKTDMKALGSEAAASLILQRLSLYIADNLTRDRIFGFLAGEIRQLFHYDRLSLCLYDSERGLFNSFTTAGGQAVETLSNTPAAHNTVAWQSIQTRQPIVINGLIPQERCGEGTALPPAELKATVVCPLICGGEVIGTLHCSFAQSPANIVDMLNFLLALCPLLSTLLFTVLTEERTARRKEIPHGPAEQGAKAEAHPDSCLFETTDMQEVMSLARKVAKLHIPVLIHGESGTGKSMLARWIHLHSPRCAAKFIKINCPSLAPPLFESEMSGHPRVAFAGAYARQMDSIKMAQGGSVFFDEIGTLSPEMQSRLLHVLEESSFERVGEAASIPVDIRIISATNINLETALATGQLRRDLFFRLAAVILHLPPLRQRPGDIPTLVNYYVRFFARSWQISPSCFSHGILEILYRHDWPGNIRELKNVICRLLLCSLEGKVTETLVHDSLYEWDAYALYGWDAYTLPEGPSGDIPAPSDVLPGPALPSLEDNEREHILRALRLTGEGLADPSGAAALLGISRSTLQHRILKLGLAPKSVLAHGKA